MGGLNIVGKLAKGAKKQAPFFSKADVVLDELPRTKGLGNEFLAELVKKGAKPTELKDRGIDKALKDAPKMTKAEVQKVFEQKAPPKVQEKVLTSDAPDYEEFLEAKAQEIYGVDWFDLSKDEKKKLDKMFSELPLTQYDKYKTPGGENYREILLKLPAFNDKRLMELEADIRRSEGVYRDPMSMPDFRAKLKELETLKAEQAAAGTPYVSGHYKQDPNLLAHIRVQDFKTPEGKKVLLVDELQSDWHQEGRKRGYGDSLKEGWKLAEQEPGFFFLQKEGMSMPMASGTKEQMMERANYYGAVSKGIPDAPFKKNWHELAMKRVLDYAAENGYDSVAITPGAEQAKRYDLSKQIGAIEYSKSGDDNYKIKVFDPVGQPMSMNIPNTLDASGLEQYIGKEMAEKIASQATREQQSLAGLDLQVGGEGMKGFYDKILPDYLNNYGKKYGAQTGQISLRTPSGEPWNVEDAARFHGMSGADYLDNPNRSQLEKQFLESRDNQTTGFHSFDITPQMREEIKTKGQPMYGKVATPVLEGLAAGSGAATIGSQMFDENNEQTVQNPVHFTENPDAMLLELMQRN